MTKEQEEAIEKLEYVNRYYDCNNYYSRYELDCIETVLSMLKEKDKEIEKKDKIIDLMTKAMDKIQDIQVCKYCDNKINLNHGYCVDARKCKEGIKQYFERKASK